MSPFFWIEYCVMYVETETYKDAVGKEHPQLNAPIYGMCVQIPVALQTRARHAPKLNMTERS